MEPVSSCISRVGQVPIVYVCVSMVVRWKRAKVASTPVRSTARTMSVMIIQKRSLFFVICFPLCRICCTSFCTTRKEREQTHAAVMAEDLISMHVEIEAEVEIDG